MSRFLPLSVRLLACALAAAVLPCASIRADLFPKTDAGPAEAAPPLVTGSTPLPRSALIGGGLLALLLSRRLLRGRGRDSGIGL